MEILIPILVLGGIGLFLGLFLAFASKKFEVKMDPNVEKVLNALPGVNCGACGYPGCNGYAEAVVNNKADITLCAPGAQKVIDNIASILGLDAIDADPKTARVICQGDNTKTKKKYEFDIHLKTCATSNLYFAGDKSCNFGCLGYGDCVRACPFGAIEINDKGIAVVDEEKCTGCTKCVKACPKYLIKMVPKSSKVTVLCNSIEKGAVARKECTTACIGCFLCQKACPEGAITIENNLAKIDYKKCTNCGVCILKCPTKAIKSNIERKIDANALDHEL